MMVDAELLVLGSVSVFLLGTLIEMLFVVSGLFHVEHEVK